MSDERTAPYTTVELAQTAGVTDAYIRYLLLRGKLTGEKRGRDWFIPVEEGRRWLASRRERWEKF